MVSNLIASFIEGNSSDIDDESSTYPNGSELKIVSKILQKDGIRTQISRCFEDLKAKASSSKTISQSDKYREEGNRLFRADKKTNALAASRYYTNALLAAPEDSLALALAHANRAASLAEFGYYFDAYCDCELALKLGYPKEKHVKLLMRQAFCSVKMKSYDKLEDAMEKLRGLELNDECAKQRDKYEEHMKTIAELPGSWKEGDAHDYKVQNISLHPKKGRCMVAWKDYQQGEVVLAEKAFAFVPVNNAKICSYCAKEQFIPYPCYKCSKVVYCSLNCKLANESIHKFECFGYRCHLFESLGITHLALKTLICGLPEIINELKNCSSAEEIWEQIEAMCRTHRKGYFDVLLLYNQLPFLHPKTIRVLALGSIVAANYLVSWTTFPEFYRESRCSASEWLSAIAALILRHAVQMIGNAESSVAVGFLGKSYDFLALTEIWYKPQHIRKGLLHGFREIDVSFAGIYPYLSLCNHSCEPSIRLNYDGNRVIARSRHDLEKGDEIFNSYVLDCRNSPKRYRIDELMSLYHFECDCDHCDPANNDKEYLQFHQYQCRNCNELFVPSPDSIRWWVDIEENDCPSIICSSCKTQLPVSWFINFEKLFQVTKFGRKELKEALKLFEFSEKIAYGTELQSYMAFKIVTSFFGMWKENRDEEMFFKYICQILKRWLEQVELQNGVESVLYATTSTFALDLMAKGKCFDFDTKKIRLSFDMLPTQLRTIFENYIEDFIGSKFDDHEKEAN